MSIATCAGFGKPIGVAASAVDVRHDAPASAARAYSITTADLRASTTLAALMKPPTIFAAGKGGSGKSGCLARVSQT